MSKGKALRLIMIGLVACLLAGAAVAQETTIDIRQGEVLSVYGNTFVVRGPMGVFEITAADDFRFDMDGKQLSVHDLRPGMPITAVVKTVKKPVEVTATEVRSAEVLHTNGYTIVVRNDKGEIKKFTAKEMAAANLVIYRDNKAVDSTSLRKGDKISATVVTKQPPTIMTTQELNVYVQNPPPPPPRPKLVQVTRKPVPAQLPATGSRLPLVALVGGIFLAAGLALTLGRKLLG